MHQVSPVPFNQSIWRQVPENFVFPWKPKILVIKGVVVYAKVKWSRYMPGVAQRVGRGIALLFHDHGLRMGEWSAARPGRTLPPGKTRHPFYRRLGGPQGRSGQAESLVPFGIGSRTVQPVVSRYTDWATGPTLYMFKCLLLWITDRMTALFVQYVVTLMCAMNPLILLVA